MTNKSLATVPHETENKFARTRAEILIKSCPIAKDGPDPKAVAAAVYKLFLKYPLSVVEAVSDPVVGLPSRQRFGLVIADVAEALETAMGTIRRTEERIHRAEEFKRIVETKPAATDGERDRAIASWEARKAEERGQKSQKESAAEANEFLREGWRDQRWNTNVHPVKVSNELRRNLEAKAKPDYVPLESGQGRGLNSTD